SSAATTDSATSGATTDSAMRGAALPDAVTSARADAPASGPRSGTAAQQLSPAVRRLLAEHSLDAASLQGTGEGGRITVADVMRAAARPSPAPATDSNDVQAAACRRVPHSAVRKRIAARMVESLLHTAP